MCDLDFNSINIFTSSNECTTISDRGRDECVRLCHFAYAGYGICRFGHSKRTSDIAAVHHWGFITNKLPVLSMLNISYGSLAGAQASLKPISLFVDRSVCQLHTTTTDSHTKDLRYLWLFLLCQRKSHTCLALATTAQLHVGTTTQLYSTSLVAIHRCDANLPTANLQTHFTLTASIIGCFFRVRKSYSVVNKVFQFMTTIWSRFLLIISWEREERERGAVKMAGSAYEQCALCRWACTLVRQSCYTIIHIYFIGLYSSVIIHVSDEV